MSFSFPPKGWAFCNGQQLPINQNQALFALLGTTYGGNGQTTFALPDLRGRTPIHVGSGFTLGQVGGEQNHTLSVAEMPTHIHVASGSNAVGNQTTPGSVGGGNIFAQDPGNAYTGQAQSLLAFPAGTITNAGGSQAHQNMQPYLALSFCIALQGIFPSPN